MKNRTRQFAFLFWLLLSALSIKPAAAQVDPLGGIALGAAFKIFGDQLKEVEEKAIGGGMLLEIQAGGQASILLQQAEHAYEKKLDLTYSRLTAADQQVINNLASVMHDLLNDVHTKAADIIDRAQGVINSLPFSKGFPQVLSFSPAYTVQAKEGHVHLQVHGNFVDAVDPKYLPTATVNGVSLVITGHTILDLEFEIPVSALAVEPNQLKENSITITVPHKKKSFIFSTTENAQFLIPITVLPKEVGKLVFHTSLTVPGTERQNFVSSEFAQESGDDDIKCGGEHADLAIHKVLAESGWTILPSTVTWRVNWSQGKQGANEDWWLESNCSSATTACLCVSTEHHRTGTSGKVHFNIMYTAERSINNVSNNDVDASLKWGEQKGFEVPNGGNWHATFIRFDGKQFDIPTVYKDAFLDVKQAGNFVTFKTIP